MKKEVKLPEIADNVVSGYLSRVLVKVGDVITADQSVIEIETDKAATDIPSPYGGRVVDIRANAGDEIRVGQTILVVESEEGRSEEVRGEGVKNSENGKSGKNALGEPDVLNDQGVVITAKAGSPSPAMNLTSSAPPLPRPEGARERGPGGEVPASPSVRRFARELGVDIAKVKGSGVAGRISDEDVKAFAKQLIQGAIPAGPAEYAAVPDFSQWGPVEVQPMSRIRQITAESTVKSWQTIPQVVQFGKTDITEVEKFRLASKGSVEKAGGKLTMTAILLKVSAMALKQFPKFNASVDMRNRQIVMKNYINIGIAVDTEQGLLVPVVRDVDRKSLTELSVELAGIAERARTRKLTSEEMQGGNFTISNLGGIFGTSFTPIVYPNQVAILGVSKASTEPVYIDGAFVPRTILPLSLSYDHRLIDGADGARFLGWICTALEQPFTTWL